MLSNAHLFLFDVGTIGKQLHKCIFIVLQYSGKLICFLFHHNLPKFVIKKDRYNIPASYYASIMLFYS